MNSAPLGQSVGIRWHQLIDCLSVDMHNTSYTYMKCVRYDICTYVHIYVCLCTMCIYVIYVVYVCWHVYIYVHIDTYVSILFFGHAYMYIHTLIDCLSVDMHNTSHTCMKCVRYCMFVHRTCVYM